MMSSFKSKLNIKKPTYNQYLMCLIKHKRDECYAKLDGKTTVYRLFRV